MYRQDDYLQCSSESEQIAALVVIQRRRWRRRRSRRRLWRTFVSWRGTRARPDRTSLRCQVETFTEHVDVRPTQRFQQLADVRLCGRPTMSRGYYYSWHSLNLLNLQPFVTWARFTKKKSYDDYYTIIANSIVRLSRKFVYCRKMIVRLFVHRAPVVIFCCVLSVDDRHKLFVFNEGHYIRVRVFK